MNKIRIIGLLLISIGVVVMLFLKGDLADISGGLFTGAGIGLLITGRIKFVKSVIQK